MNQVSGRGVARSTLMLMAVQVLVLAAGFVIAMFLTRRLGPSEYGTYAVVVNIITWAEITVAAVLRQATIRLLSEADDWRATIGAIVRTLALIGLVMAALLIGLAPLISTWLADPALAGYIRLYALDVPLFALSSVLVAALLGRRSFGRAGLVTLVGRGGRLSLMLVLVGSGLGVTGALLAAIGSSLLELIASWFFVRPRLLGKSALSRRVLWTYSLPLFVRSVGLQLFRRLDLMTVKALEGAASAGFYGAARSLTVIPSSRLIVSFSQVLLASLPRLLATGHVERARALMTQSLRWVLVLTPFAALAAGAAPEIVHLVYGDSYAPTASAVGSLAIGAVGLSVLLISSSMLTASSRPRLSLAIMGPLAPLSLVGSLVLVPRLGIAGAAATVAVLSWLGAGASMLIVRRICGARVSIASLLRVALTTSFAYGVASLWHVAGVWVVVKLLVLCAGVGLFLLVLGELRPADLAFVRSVLRPELANRENRSSHADSRPR